MYMHYIHELTVAHIFLFLELTLGLIRPKQKFFGLRFAFMNRMSLITWFLEA